MNRPFVPVKICGLTREADVDAAVAAGALTMPPVIRTPLSQVVDAHLAQEAGPVGKILVDIA